MGSKKKNNLPLKFKFPRVDTLLALSSKITPCKKRNFICRYGQILDLLTTYVNVSALVALSQYYDPSLICFTFKGFQLALTIEEYEKLLGLFVKDHPPFAMLGELLMSESVFEALHLSVEEVALGLGPKGFSRKLLEEKAWALEKEGKLVPLSATLALLIYGVVLFLNDDNYINPSIISVFVSGNPVPALVYDVYYCLHTRREKRKGVVLSYASLLYTWLLSHTPQNGPWVNFLKDLRWSQKFSSLTAEVVVWYHPTSNIEQVIVSCGDFLNVPFMGPRGCINYNPSLAMRQLGYLMENETRDEFLKDFTLPSLGAENQTLLQKVKQAWTQIHRKDKELGKRDCRAKKPYC
ncbi:uncharacterized protein LOC127094788 [Lathyrus oleraceus]|uniref:uncharacterized protein LOC127094788 n=1 Tax=Pisum sativum TaxID=3888 RepID=UPI0021CE6C06|nr:uncharacterized protein LOC127094788 [Pisum sativum]